MTEYQKKAEKIAYEKYPDNLDTESFANYNEKQFQKRKAFLAGATFQEDEMIKLLEWIRTFESLEIEKSNRQWFIESQITSEQLVKQFKLTQNDNQEKN